MKEEDIIFVFVVRNKSALLPGRRIYPDFPRFYVIQTSLETIWYKSYPKTYRNVIENCFSTGAFHLFIFLLIKKKKSKGPLYANHFARQGVTDMLNTIPDLKNPMEFLIDTMNLIAHFINNGDF